MLLSQCMCRKKLAKVYVGKEFNINILGYLKDSNAATFSVDTGIS